MQKLYCQTNILSKSKLINSDETSNNSSRLLYALRQWSAKNRTLVEILMNDANKSFNADSMGMSVQSRRSIAKSITLIKHKFGVNKCIGVESQRTKVWKTSSTLCLAIRWNYLHLADLGGAQRFHPPAQRIHKVTGKCHGDPSRFA